MIVLIIKPTVQNASMVDTGIDRDSEMDSSSDVIQEEYVRDVTNTRIFSV